MTRQPTRVFHRSSSPNFVAVALISIVFAERSTWATRSAHASRSGHRSQHERDQIVDVKAPSVVLLGEPLDELPLLIAG